MMDYCFQSFMHQVRDRHGPDSPLAVSLGGASYTVERARDLHKEKGAQSHDVIKRELMPQFLRHIKDIEKGIGAAGNTKVRDDYGQAYGVALDFKNSLSSLARISPGEWSVAELDMKAEPPRPVGRWGEDGKMERFRS